MKVDRHYVRVYHDDLVRDYPDIYADDGALATWLRLLVLADKMWPTPAELPRSVKMRPLRLLVDRRLVELVEPHSFRIRGHDAERTKRSDAARNAAAGRWQDNGNATGIAPRVPSRAETEDEPSQAEIPPPPAQRGRRKDGTNPRSVGSDPRSNGHAPRDRGTSPRQERQAQKTGPTSLHEILRKAAAAGDAS